MLNSRFPTWQVMTLKWLIKNPAPTDGRQKKWGDYHFGRSLALALQRLGHVVDTDYWPEWENDKQSDVVLVLRGKYSYERKGPNRDALHLMWNISHPADVRTEEYQHYDRVFVASEQHARVTEQHLPGRVHSLLQCTDPEQFYPRQDGTGEDSRRNIIFVGNTRSERRELVLATAKACHSVKVWGRGWRSFELGDRVVADYIENEQLGNLYRSARICLNDHWPDMIEHGFINNRIFDALACGLPLVSDKHPSVENLFASRGLLQTDAGTAGQAIGHILMRYPAYLEAAHEAAEWVREEHSFDTRASVLAARAIG